MKKTARFAFKQPRNTATFVCGHVFEGKPIAYAFHDPDGDWQFLCGAAHDEANGDKPKLICLEDVVALDPSVNELASMCTNHHAERPTPTAAWRIVDDGEEFILQCVKDPGWAVQLIPEGDCCEAGLLMDPRAA